MRIQPLGCSNPEYEGKGIRRTTNVFGKRDEAEYGGGASLVLMPCASIDDKGVAPALERSGVSA